jgi:hypothetical protein
MIKYKVSSSHLALKYTKLLYVPNVKKKLVLPFVGSIFLLKQTIGHNSVYLLIL